MEAGLDKNHLINLSTFSASESIGKEEGE